MSTRHSSNDNSAAPQFNYAPVYHLGGNVTQDDLAQVMKLQAQDRAAFTQTLLRQFRNFESGMQGFEAKRLAAEQAAKSAGNMGRASDLPGLIYHRANQRG
jgi:hypothetical protein